MLCGMTRRRFQTKTEIEALLAGAGVRPRRRQGQNFLIDGNLMNRLLVAADVSGDDAVLEVGAGTGGLTEHLATLAGRLVAVEIDPVLHRIVQHRLGDAANVTLIRQDVLASKHQLAPAVSEALVNARRAVPGRMMLVANLPYKVATPLLANLLLHRCGFDRFCFTVQREVADRLLAPSGTKQYGPISIAIQCTCRVERLAALPPQVFWPRPAVESAMLKLDVGRNPFGTVERLGRFMELLRAGFAHRRKTLKYNLARVAGEDVYRTLADAFDLSRRPEALSVDEWVALGTRWAAHLFRGGGRE